MTPVAQAASLAAVTALTAQAFDQLAWLAAWLGLNWLGLAWLGLEASRPDQGGSSGLRGRLPARLFGVLWLWLAGHSLHTV